VEHELAAWGSDVDHLLQAAELDTAVGQPGDGVDQVPEGAAEAVEFPDDQGVTGAELVQELLEGGAVGSGAAGGLGEHPVAAGTLEGVDLELWPVNHQDVPNLAATSNPEDAPARRGPPEPDPNDWFRAEDDPRR
jgi:hypothetical protein